MTKLAESTPKVNSFEYAFLLYVISEVFKILNKIKIIEYIKKNKVLSK